MRSICVRKHGQDLWTMNEKRRKELQLFTSRPEGCEIPSLHSSGKTVVAQLRSSTARVTEHSTRMQAQGGSGCVSARSCLSAAAAAFRDCGASGSASATRTSGPCAKESCRTPILFKQSRVELPKCEPGRRRPFRRVQKPWSVRLCDGLPRSVAVLGDRRLVQSALR